MPRPAAHARKKQADIPPPNMRAMISAYGGCDWPIALPAQLTDIRGRKAKRRHPGRRRGAAAFYPLASGRRRRPSVWGAPPSGRRRRAALNDRPREEERAFRVSFGLDLWTQPLAGEFVPRQKEAKRGALREEEEGAAFITRPQGGGGRGLRFRVRRSRPV